MVSIKYSDVDFAVPAPVVRWSFYVQSQCGYTDFFVFNYSVNLEGLVLFQHQLKPIKDVFNVVGVFIGDHLVKGNQKNVNVTVLVPQAGFEWSVKLDVEALSESNLANFCVYFFELALNCMVDFIAPFFESDNFLGQRLSELFFFSKGWGQCGVLRLFNFGVRIWCLRAIWLSFVLREHFWRLIVSFLVHGSIVLLFTHLPVVNLICFSDQIVDLLLCVGSEDFLGMVFIITVLSGLAIVSVLSILSIISMFFVLSLLLFEIFVFEFFSGFFLPDWGLLPFLVGRGNLYFFLCPFRAFISVWIIIFVIFVASWSLFILFGDFFTILIDRWSNLSFFLNESWLYLYLSNQLIQWKLLSKLKDIFIFFILDHGIGSILNEHFDNILVGFGLFVLAHLKGLMQRRVSTVGDYIIGRCVMVEQDSDELRFLFFDSKDQESLVIGSSIGLR